MKRILIYFLVILISCFSLSCTKKDSPVESINSLTWINGLQGYYILSIATNEDNIYVSTSDGHIFLSEDNGSNWTPLSTNFFLGYSQPSNYRVAFKSNIYALIFTNDNLFAGTGFGFYGDIFLSIDKGMNWTKIDSGLNHSCVNCFATIDNNIFAGTNNGIFISNNNGRSWNATGTGCSYQVYHLATIGTHLFAGTSSTGVFLSTDNGTSWSAVNNGFANTSTCINGFASIGTNLFAGVFQMPDDSAGGVFISSNYGTTWSAVNTGLKSHRIYALVASGTNLFVGTDSGIFLSTNNGDNWVDISAGTSADSLAVNTLEVNGRNLLIGATNGIWRLPF